MNKHLTYEEWFNEHKDYKDAYKTYFEQTKEIDRLNNIINEIENYCWELKAMGCREGALDMLDKLKALKEDNK